MTVKTAFLALLFNDTFYVMDSETALERDYAISKAALTMIVRPDVRQFQLLDKKYTGLQELGLAGDKVKQTARSELQALPLVQQKLAASRRKLAGYHATLQKVYGDQLDLRTYSVVALGFERLLWDELTPPRVQT